MGGDDDVPGWAGVNAGSESSSCLKCTCFKCRVSAATATPGALTEEDKEVPEVFLTVVRVIGVVQAGALSRPTFPEFYSLESFSPPPTGPRYHKVLSRLPPAPAPFPLPERLQRTG